jgi:hypothetical protein
VSRTGKFVSERQSLNIHLVYFSLFLKCKHTAGSGSGAGNNCNSKDAEKSQQLAINVKAVLAQLQERKEDFEKLKQKLERLEVRGARDASSKFDAYILSLSPDCSKHRRNSLTCHSPSRASATERNG